MFTKIYSYLLCRKHGARIIAASLLKLLLVGIADGFGIVINPRPEGYGSRFVVHSFCPPRYKEQRSLLRAS